MKTYLIATYRIEQTPIEVLAGIINKRFLTNYSCIYQLRYEAILREFFRFMQIYTILINRVDVHGKDLFNLLRRECGYIQNPHWFLGFKLPPAKNYNIFDS